MSNNTPRKRRLSETDEQWNEVLEVSKCMIHMKNIACDVNQKCENELKESVDVKLILPSSYVTPESKKKANPYKEKKMLNHSDGLSDSFKRKEAEAHRLNYEHHCLKEKQRYEKEIQNVLDELDDDELLCIDLTKKWNQQDRSRERFYGFYIIFIK